MSLYALMTAGFFLTLWGIVVKNTGNFASLVLVKIVPAIIGLWCLWEALLIIKP